MSVKKYFELNSTYRDRSIYPNPASFVVQKTSPPENTDEAVNTKTPVTFSMPCYNFQSFDLITGTYGDGNQFGPGTPSIPHLGDLNGGSSAVFLDGYYNGMTLGDTTGGVVNSSSTIISYNGTVRSCQLASRLSDNWLSSNTYEIINTSNGDGTLDGPSTVVIHGAPAQNDYFHNYLLEDVSLDPTVHTTFESRFKRINKYDGTTRRAFIGNKDTGCSEAFTGYQKSDAFRIRQELPTTMGFGTVFLGNAGRNIPYNAGIGNTGTGPENGENGAAYIVSFVENRGGNFIGGTPPFAPSLPGTYALLDLTSNSGSGSGIDIEVTITNDSNGNSIITNPRVISPGGGYGIGDELQWVCNPVGGPKLIFKVEAVGQSVDVTNARTNSANLVGSLPTQPGTISSDRKRMEKSSPIGSLLYVPSKGPENQYVDGSEYYKQLPPKLSTDNFDCQEDRPPTGSATIIGYLYSTATQFIDGACKPNPFNSTAWLIVENEKTSTSGVITGYSQPVTGSPVPDSTVTSAVITVPGSGYVDATGVPTTGGTGTGLTVDITTAAGAVTGVVINNPGVGYSTGDVLTITGGNGDATITLTVTSITLKNPGTGYVDAIGVPTTGGSGTGLTVDITTNAGTVTGVIINTPGVPPPPYTNGDELTITGGNGDATIIFNNTNAGAFDSVSWEIQPFNIDTAAPFNTTISNLNASRTYEVELLKLIVPNVSLKTGIGGRISFYPYLYVVLQTGDSTTVSTFLSSNNPNANIATFLVPINNAPSPVISKFIHVSGEGAVQTIPFDPTQAITFKIFLTDGNDFVMIEDDNAPPEIPNPYLQISALFEFREVNSTLLPDNSNNNVVEGYRRWGNRR